MKAPLWQDFLHGSGQIFPFLNSAEIVKDDKASSREVGPKISSFFIGDVPISRLTDIENGVIHDQGIVHIQDQIGIRCGLYGCDFQQDLQEVLLGPRVVMGPGRRAPTSHAQKVHITVVTDAGELKEVHITRVSGRIHFVQTQDGHHGTGKDQKNQCQSEDVFHCRTSFKSSFCASG